MAFRNALMPFDLPQAASVSALTNPLMAGMQTYRQGMQQQFEGDRALERERLARKADSRADEDQSMQREARLTQRMGALAQVIADDPNPTTAAANWSKLHQSMPQLRERMLVYGVDPNNYKAGASFLAAEAGKYQSPLDLQMKRAQLGQIGKQGQMMDAQLAQMKLATPEKRAEVAAQFGLQPGTPAYQSFVLMGTLPQKGEESTLDKEIAKTRVDMAEKDIKAAVGAQDMGSVLSELDTIAKDKGLFAAIGPLQGTTTAQTMTGAIPFAQQLGIRNPELNARIQRFQSQLVVAGGEKMKGLGAQSDSDANRLQEAVGKLSSARTPQEFNNAIAIIRHSISGAVARGHSAAKQFPALGNGRISTEAAPQQRFRYDPASGDLVPAGGP